MKFLLLAVIAFTAIYAQRRDVVPRELIERAERIIAEAETELERHFLEGRRQLAQQFMVEIEEVHIMIRELRALEQERHLEMKRLHEFEERFLHQENRLMEESLIIANRHDEQERRDNPGKEFNEKILPEMMIRRARELIERAQEEVRRFHEQNLQHLTREMEAEIKEVEALERELQGLEKDRHLEVHKVHEVDERLMRHEHRLAEFELAIYNRHLEDQGGR